MKTNMKSILLITSISLSLLACGNKNEQQDEATQSVEAKSGEREDITQQDVKQVLHAYLEIKNALVQSDGEAASAAAKKLTEAASSKGDIVKQIIQDSKEIQGTQELEKQRKHFLSLSDKIYKLIEKGEGLDQNLYWQYCPMANDNKGGYWLSSEEEIKNPYFGEKMLTCGVVKETL